MNIPLDVIDRLFKDYESKDLKKAFQIIRKWLEYSGYEGTQYSRCLLFLAKGDINELERINEYGKNDPRDVIWDAEKKAGNKGHWFGISFDEIEKLNGMEYKQPLYEKVKDPLEDNLPF